MANTLPGLRTIVRAEYAAKVAREAEARKRANVRAMHAMHKAAKQS